jgi:hypothetical protein
MRAALEGPAGDPSTAVPLAVEDEPEVAGGWFPIGSCPIGCNVRPVLGV